MIYYIGIGASVIVGCFILKSVYKVWGPSKYNVYDEEDKIASLGKECVFCNVVLGSEAPIYEDSQIIAIYDKYPQSSTHILLIPKRHIKNLYSLRPDDLELIEHMKNVAEDIKNDLSPLSDAHIGFHHPIFTSIQHLHLHLLIMPFTTFAGKIIFNRLSFVEASKHIAKLKLS